MKPRTAAAVVLLAAIAWFAASRVAGERPTSRPLPVPDPAPVTDRVRGVTDWVAGLAGTVKGSVAGAAENPTVLLAVLAVIVLVIVVRAVRARMPVTQDPQRMYTPEQRKEMFARAGGQCEYTGLLPWTRCRKPAEHADHLFPWSRGGATTLANGVASCARHNTSKGAKVLPAWQVRALVRRRRRYYPAGVDTAVGEKFADVVASGAPAR